MPKRLSDKDKDELTISFTEGVDIKTLSENFNCSKLTITRNLKKKLGDDKYDNLINKFKALQNGDSINVNYKKDLTLNQSEDECLINDTRKKESLFDKPIDEISIQNSSFIEIAPLNNQIDIEPRKELSSVPLSEIKLPNIVYMIVDKKIELETKLLKYYPIWQFLPETDLNRKTIEIHLDLKLAHKKCSKDQKVIKVPNSDVFRIATPILLSRGISRIISDQQLIAL